MERISYYKGRSHDRRRQSQDDAEGEEEETRIHEGRKYVSTARPAAMATAVEPPIPGAEAARRKTVAQSEKPSALPTANQAAA